MTQREKTLKIALAGNPNSGKSTLFNSLTGDSQNVGNWSGVTVEIASACFNWRDYSLELVDLPGLYSLFPHTLEQISASEFLTNPDQSQLPDLIVDVVDANNLERGLYLASQLLEIGLPLFIALNMCDELAERGLDLDAAALGELLGVPCYKISATKEQGIEELLEAVVFHYNDAALFDFQHFGRGYYKLKTNISTNKTTPSWRFTHQDGWQKDSDNSKEEDSGLSEWRYQVITGIVAQVTRRKKNQERQSVSRKIDAILCHPLFAYPCFLLIMLLVFYLSFGSLGLKLQGLISQGLSKGLVPLIQAFLEFSHAPLWLQGLSIDGVIAGVGGIMIFLPQLAFLFFFLSLLEDSGYMARVAFITDRLLARFGLSGKAFIPMILGFGCSVPALMACRGLDRRQRLATMIVVPFVSCGGRLPIYALFAAAFFAGNQGLVVFSLYLLGIVVGLCSTLLLQSLFSHNQEKKNLFIMEMPPYRWPIWHCIRRRLWLRLKGFIVTAGSIILLASVVIWFLSNYNIRLQVVSEGSMLQSLGKVFTPALKPLGFGQWQSTVALLNGFLNKEGVISSLSVLYGDVGGPGGLSLALQSIFTPLSAYAFMVFALLYTPCVATIAALRREAGSTWFALFCVAWQIVVAWLLTFLVYNGGRLLGWG